MTTALYALLALPTPALDLAAVVIFAWAVWWVAGKVRRGVACA